MEGFSPKFVGTEFSEVHFYRVLEDQKFTWWSLYPAALRADHAGWGPVRPPQRYKDPGIQRQREPVPWVKIDHERHRERGTDDRERSPPFLADEDANPGCQEANPSYNLKYREQA